MKYIEELIPGNTFTKDNKLFILTTDFKKNNAKLAYCLSDGCPFWFNPSEVVLSTPIYHIDEKNNVVPIKPIYNTPTNLS